MSALLVGYARCSTDQQDLTAQRDALLSMGVGLERIYVDHGLTGTDRDRPGLREALAPCRAGDTLAVTKLDRLARSLPDPRAIADELTTRQISLSLGGSVYDPTDAVGRLLFNVLAMVAEFESDPIRLRTREGMKVAKAKGRLRGKQPKLNRKQEAHLVSLVHSGEYSTLEVAELFGVGRSTVYRAIERQRVAAKGRPRRSDRATLTRVLVRRPASDTRAGRRRHTAPGWACAPRDVPVVGRCRGTVVLKTNGRDPTRCLCRRVQRRAVRNDRLHRMDTLESTQARTPSSIAVAAPK